MDKKEFDELQEQIYKDWQNEVRELVKHSGFNYDNLNQELLYKFIKDKINIIKKVINDNIDVSQIFKTLITATCNELDKSIELLEKIQNI